MKMVAKGCRNQNIKQCGKSTANAASQRTDCIHSIVFQLPHLNIVVMVQIALIS